MNSGEVELGGQNWSLLIEFLEGLMYDLERLGRLEPLSKLFQGRGVKKYQKSVNVFCEQPLRIK